MTRRWRVLLALACAAGLSIVGMIGSAKRASAVQITPVQVVNTPLPVSGQVNVANTPNVRIINPADRPVLVHETGNAERATPFQRFTSVSLGSGTSGSSDYVNVPPNTLVVLDHVSVSATVPAGQQVTASIRCTHPGNTVDHALVMSFQGEFPAGSVFTASQPLKCYAFGDPDVEVPGFMTSTVRSSTSGGPFLVRFSLSGHQLTP